MSNQMTGPQLKKLRERVGVSSAAIARAAGVNSGMIWFFEHGKVKAPAHLKEILAAYDHLDELGTKPARGPAKEKKKRGRPGRPPKEKAKRKYTRKAKPAPEPKDESDPDDGLDDCMKATTRRGHDGRRGKKAAPQEVAKPGALDDEWLKAQMDNWTKTRRVVVVNMETPGEPEAPAKRFLMVSEAQVFALGRDIMTACKRPVNQA